MSFDERIQKLREISQGWLNYFRMASIHGKLKETGRMAAKPTKVLHLASLEENLNGKGKNLIQLGIDPETCLPMEQKPEWEDGQLPKAQF